jgi:tRNA-specific A34 adenosine deaminase
MEAAMGPIGYAGDVSVLHGIEMNVVGVALRIGVIASAPSSGAFYRINAHGQDVSLSVNAMSFSHAEAVAFQQAQNARVYGGYATLYVDRDLYDACGQNGGVKGVARQLEFGAVSVFTPSGPQTIRPQGQATCL